MICENIVNSLENVNKYCLFTNFLLKIKNESKSPILT